MVAPLGGRRLLPPLPAHRVTYGQPAATWMAWYVRAVERWLGLPSAVVDKTYLDGYLKHLEHLVIGQISYLPAQSQSPASAPLPQHGEPTASGRHRPARSDGVRGSVLHLALGFLLPEGSLWVVRLSPMLDLHLWLLSGGWVPRLAADQ